jgi:hypothetical protein
MRKVHLTTFILFFCLPGFSQELPIASPKCTLEQRIGLTDTKITYSRPSVRNREIYGSLIPNGTHWRLGANERTLFESSSMFIINDQKIEEGIYSLSMMCDKDEWTLILNRDIEGWGVTNHNPSLDVARISVPVTHDLFAETMSITWDSITETTATLNICWEKTCASYRFKFPTEKLALQNIKVELGREHAPWTSWKNAARYALSKDWTQGAEWAAKALELKPDDWSVNFLNAQYASKANQNKEAKKLAKRALELGKTEASSKGVKFEYEATIEAFIKDLK